MEAEAVCQGFREGRGGRGVSTRSGERAGLQVIPPFGKTRVNDVTIEDSIE
jgi:hypothetical protein